MKNRNLLSAVLIMCMTVVTGCNVGKNSSSKAGVASSSVFSSESSPVESSSSSSSSSSEVINQRSKEELFTELKKGFNSDFSQEEELTLDFNMYGSMFSCYSSNLYYVEFNQRDKYSIDSKNNNYFYINDLDYKDKDITTNEKTLGKKFKEDEKTYFYNNYVLEEESLFSTHINEDSQYLLVNDNYNDIDLDFSSGMEEVFNFSNADSFDEYVKAYDKYFKDLKENKGYYSYLITTNYKYSVDIQETELGIELKVWINYCGRFYTSEVSYYETSQEIMNKYVVKDEKIVMIEGFSVVRNEEKAEYKDEKINTRTSVEEINYAVNFGYIFDQETYDSIETTLPSEEYIYDRTADVTPISEYIELNVNGLKENVYFRDDSSEPTVEKAFENGINSFSNSFSNITLDDTLYYDKEMTKPFDPTEVTIEEFEEIEELYGTITVDEGYAAYQYQHYEKNLLSDEYKLLINWFDEVEETSTDSIIVDNINEVPSFSFNASSDEVYVNGTKVEENTVTINYESQGIYIIELFDYVKDESISLEYLSFVGGY